MGRWHSPQEMTNKTAETTTDMDVAGLGRGGRMSRSRTRDVVLRLLRGEDLELVSSTLGVTAATLSGWCDAFLAGGEANLAAPRKRFAFRYAHRRRGTGSGNEVSRRDGTIILDRVDAMWGTDPARNLVSAVTMAWTGGGQAAVFIAVDHHSAECVGLHAARRATRLKRWSRSAKARAAASGLRRERGPRPCRPPRPREPVHV